MAETNRTAFDFVEGGLSLFLGLMFSMVVGVCLTSLAEYASILFISLSFCIIFLGSDLYSFLFYFKFTFASFLFVWVQGTIPRFRYDKLMYLAWRRFLPHSLNHLIFCVGVRCFVAKDKHATSPWLRTSVSNQISKNL